MISKPLIEIGPMEDVERDEFLKICKETDNDPVTVAALTDTNIGLNLGEAGSISRQGRTRKARGVFREYVRAIIGAYNLPPEAAKKFIQDARMKVLFDSLRVNDSKTALEAMKQIGTDQSIFGPTQIELKVDALDDILNRTTAEVIEAVYLPDEPEDDVTDSDEKPDFPSLGNIDVGKAMEENHEGTGYEEKD